MKTEILKIKGSWEEVVDDCRSTVSKPPLGHDPRASFKRRILIAEHSPIRDLSARFRWTGIKYWIAMHWKTHHWESKVSTQRSDRTGTPRDKLPQDAPVNFTGEANPQHTIDTWRKRLCYQAAPETRSYAEDFKEAMHEVEPEWSDVLVPNCVYRCGCRRCRPAACGSAWDGRPAAALPPSTSTSAMTYTTGIFMHTERRRRGRLNSRHSQSNTGGNEWNRNT